MTETQKELLTAMAELLVQLTERALGSLPAGGYNLEGVAPAIKKVESLCAAMNEPS